MANHRSAGRAAVRKHRTVGGTHRDSTVTSGALKVGVLGVLATATIAAPLAAAAAGIDESVPQADTLAQAQPAAPAQQPAAAPAPVAIPEAAADDEKATEARTDDAANRSEGRTSPASAVSEDDKAEDKKAEKKAEKSEGAEDEKKSEKSEKAEDEKTAASAEPESSDIEVSVEEPEPEPAPAAESGESAASGEAGAAAPAAGDSGYIQPVSGPITSGFGGRVHPVLGYFKGHNGVDFGASCGTPVSAAQSGTVVAVEYNGASGNRVKIDHGNGVVTGYYHLQGFNTSVGATVSQGDTVGYVGSTGRSTGCHLHFAKMDEGGNYSDPMSILP